MKDEQGYTICQYNKKFYWEEITDNEYKRLIPVDAGKAKDFTYAELVRKKRKLHIQNDNEINILMKLKRKSILQDDQVAVNKKDSYLITDNIQGTPLSQLPNRWGAKTGWRANNEGKEKKDAFFNLGLFQKIIAKVKALHDQGIYHNNLNYDSIIVTSTNPLDIELINFGEAIIFDPKTMTNNDKINDYHSLGKLFKTIFGFPNNNYDLFEYDFEFCYKLLSTNDFDFFALKNNLLSTNNDTLNLYEPLFNLLNNDLFNVNPEKCSLLNLENYLMRLSQNHINGLRIWDLAIASLEYLNWTTKESISDRSLIKSFWSHTGHGVSGITNAIELINNLFSPDVPVEEALKKAMESSSYNNNSLNRYLMKALTGKDNIFEIDYNAFKEMTEEAVNSLDDDTIEQFVLLLDGSKLNNNLQLS